MTKKKFIPKKKVEGKPPRKEKPADYLLRIRSYPDTRRCDLWIIRNPNRVSSGVLHGFIDKEIAEDLASRLSLPVTREESPFLNREGKFLYLPDPPKPLPSGRKSGRTKR